jgi:hypothetical protein
MLGTGLGEDTWVDLADEENEEDHEDVLNETNETRGMKLACKVKQNLID